jgi:carboxylesterase type B
MSAGVKMQTAPQEKPMSFGFAFLPTTDSASGGEVFLPAPPTELLDSGKLNTVPLIAGINSHEGILALNGKSKGITDKALSYVCLPVNERFD